MRMLTSTRIAELEGQLLAAQSQAQENFRLLTGVREELATAGTNLAAVTKERDDARTSLEAAQRDLTAERESRETTISGEVTRRLAAAGIDPVKRDAKAIDTKGNAKPAGSARERLAASINQQIQK